MATSDYTFDPNDLDSIDALLDEAELEMVMDDAVEGESVEQPVAEGALADDIEAMDEMADFDIDAPDDALDALNDTEAAAVPAPKEPQADKANVKAASRTQTDEQTDESDFLSKRAAAQKGQSPKMAVKEMDSIKKLIIIFSSTLIFLVLIAIGIGIWSAMAASSAGMDDETITLIESIKINSERGASSMTESNKSTESLEKKLDALNHQLEQLVVDLAASAAAQTEVEKEVPKGVQAQGILDPLDQERVEQNIKNVETPPVVTVSRELSNPAVLKKISDVNVKMITAQRRIDEVNNRVKNIQTQYQVLLQSVKTVEKQLLLEQVSKAESNQEKKPIVDPNPYQYTAPEGMYDQSVQDSYP